MVKRRRRISIGVKLFSKIFDEIKVEPQKRIETEAAKCPYKFLECPAASFICIFLTLWLSPEDECIIINHHEKSLSTTFRIIIRFFDKRYKEDKYGIEVKSDRIMNFIKNILQF